MNLPRLTYPLYLLALSSIILTACNQPPAGGAANAGGMPAMPPPEVAVVTVQAQTVPVRFEYAAQVAGSREAEIRARVTGILLKRHYNDGQTVQAGQTLFSLDNAPYEVALAAAEAQLANAQARLSQAERNLARIKPLWEQKVVAQREYDDAVSAQQIAQADIKTAQAQIKQAKLNLSYTRVDAPISGIVGRAQKTEGTLVSGTDILLATITQINPAHVYFGLPDAEQQKNRHLAATGRFKLPPQGQYVANIKLSDGSLYPHAGRLDFTDMAVNPNTGTIEARAALPNPESQLKPGQFVRVVLNGAQRVDALVVPQRAVIEGPAGKMVMLVTKDNKIEPRPVKVGEWATINGTEAWVIDSGLQAGERVLVDGLFKAMPGTVVKPVDAASVAKATTPPNAAAPSTH
ncbi:efflux RND transporter periplasmic adaptor subunit [Agitococcus lubricus]|uniref:Membrane fusion protein (Multidrug efflux system) n=1 Tax=Agitococcus lubricus TaxID=1077255 RepID=A0A2T5IWU2_9GAMM|nr:efflux RND transporter periplasmic adaptor subunit [Agitococcus lubricus]PTQ88402.1 membrane fusion protein (multidrug efflux system) [Agitococcus lubricus]